MCALMSTGDNESLVSAGSSNSINEDPHHHSKHMKHEFAEEKLPLKDNNNPYIQNMYGKWAGATKRVTLCCVILRELFFL